MIIPQQFPGLYSAVRRRQDSRRSAASVLASTRLPVVGVGRVSECEPLRAPNSFRENPPARTSSLPALTVTVPASPHQSLENPLERPQVPAGPCDFREYFMTFQQSPRSLTSPCDFPRVPFQLQQCLPIPFESPPFSTNQVLAVPTSPYRPNMNIDALIALVKKRPALWDKSSTLYSNRSTLDRSWREIAETMKEDEDKIRKKWKYLRDQFAVEFGKVPAGTPGEVAEYEPKWKYYRSLLFLEDFVTPRATNKSTKRNTRGHSEESSDIDPSPLLVEKHERKRPRKTLVSRKKKKRIHLLQENETKQPLDISKDEHMHFFKSILPHVRTIPPNMVLAFRSRVQEVVEGYAYQPAPAISSSKPRLSTEPYFIRCSDGPKLEQFEDSQTVDTIKDDALSLSY